MKPDDIGTVPVGDFRRYLMEHDWEIVPHPNARIQVFEKRDSDMSDVSLLLPAVDNLADSNPIVNESLNILAALLGISAGKLIHQITGWDRDVLRARLFRLVGVENSLPLDTAAEILANLRQFIGDSAYTEYEPRRAFDKAGGVSRDFVHHCRFGHTFKGSFGITVESPIQTTPMLPLEGIDPEVPFERRVFERIAIGFNVLRRSIATDSIEPLLSSYKTGFNANMCRALSDTYEAVDGRRIEYDFLWSPELASALNAEWKPLIYEGRAFEFSRAAALELERADEVPESVIEGRVSALKSETPPGSDEQQEFDHVITMFWERERGIRLRIRVPLPPDQYIRACDAHKEGRKIRIFGVPEKQGKFWTLTRGRDFTVLP